MGRPPTQRRERIIECARRRFLAGGYDGTGIGQIARELGISKAAITYYFESKHDFLEEFFRGYLDDMAAVAASPAADARELLDSYLGVIINHHDVAVWLDRDPAVQNVLGDELGAANEALIAAIIGQTRSKRARVRALSMLGGIWRPARELETHELAAHRSEIVSAALRVLDAA